MRVHSFLVIRRNLNGAGDGMKRIWNALIYGDSETRKCIGSVIFFSVLAVVLIVVAGISGEFNIFIFGMIAAIVAIMISQTFTLVDDDFVAEVNRDGDKETVRSVSVQKNGLIYGESKPQSAKSKKEHTKSEQETAREQSEKKKEKKQDKKADTLETELKDVNRYANYNQKVMKRIQKKYHVKKDHRPIMIDSSETYHIKQCPAFIWRAHNKVFLLLLEKEPRKITISRELIHNMGYQPNVKADKSSEYIAFQKENLVTKVFAEYLPDYHDAKLKNDPLKVKNLYTIYPDICITNRSAYQVKDLLLLNFMPKDKITDSDMVNGFFKRIYAANIMFKDKVITINEYKEEVELALKEMCYAEVSRREYIITLENLFKARLISKQYVTHYTAMRDKIRDKIRDKE